MGALDKVRGRKDLQEAFEKNEGKEVIIDLIANENHIPRFVARLIYGRVEERLKEQSLDEHTERMA